MADSTVLPHLVVSQNTVERGLREDQPHERVVEQVVDAAAEVSLDVVQSGATSTVTAVVCAVRLSSIEVSHVLVKVFEEFFDAPLALICYAARVAEVTAHMVAVVGVVILDQSFHRVVAALHLVSLLEELVEATVFGHPGLGKAR